MFVCLVVIGVFSLIVFYYWGGVYEYVFVNFFDSCLNKGKKFL